MMRESPQKHVGTMKQPEVLEGQGHKDASSEKGSAKTDVLPSPNPFLSRESSQESSQVSNGKEWEAQKRELVDSLQRLAAEFDNYKKRAAKDSAMERSLACKELMLDLLPVLDHFELALASGKELPEHSRQGFELMYAQLVSILESKGLRLIEALGTPFDPLLHEALLSEPGPQKNKVIEVLQRGYRLHDAVLRTAKVKIST